jgi:predicted transposase YbfD/YdcC
MIESRRVIGENETMERRYFISSLPGHVAQRIGQAARIHWTVENELHWSLDVSFNEDQSRSRIKNAAENFSRLRRMALTLLKQDTTTKAGIKARRLKAGWDETYLLKILGFKF